MEKSTEEVQHMNEIQLIKLNDQINDLIDISDQLAVVSCQFKNEQYKETINKSIHTECLVMN